MFNNYNVNWDLFVKRLTDEDRRTPIALAWIRSLIAPVVNLHTLFLNFKAQTLKVLLYNAQVIYLEKGLNDVFNVDYPATFALPIFISDPSASMPELVFYADTDGMNTPVMYADSDNPTTPVMYADSDFGLLDDYIINVPISLIDLTANPGMIDEIKAFVNQYNQCDKNYSIVNY